MKRIAALEKRLRLQDDELIWPLEYFYVKGKPKPVFPSEEEQIARQRAEGKRYIVVKVPVELSWD